MKSLVIVESPAKARTIEKFLGDGYEVKASYGHVRDLPNSAAEIPAEIKKEKWARLGINIDKEFEPLYVIPDEKKKHVKELRDALKGAGELLLATDEDREGESISWHLVDVLRPKVPYKRLVFHEITRSAIQNALSSSRSIDENLVRAQETRRLIDRLFGYSLSPLLWKKMAPRLSAGRVQSVAIKLLVERERQRMSFRSAGYWDLKAVFQKPGDGSFEADLTHVGGKRVAIGKDFDPLTGKLEKPDDLVLLDAASANALRETLLKEAVRVDTVEEKPYTTRPYPPFTTSTLQQEASRQLRLTAKRTMSIAQILYENGVITYMRADSTNLSDEAIEGARSYVIREFGQHFLHDTPRVYKTKVKNAQEAHEAIRPAGAEFMHPSVVKERFGVEAFRLYELIWKRTLASQMRDAQGTSILVRLQCGQATFRASGKTISFPGFLRAYVEGADDPEAEMADREKLLPKMAVGEELQTNSMEALEHFTQPPARYTEGSLIKELERLGIGRPSTWATIVEVVLTRTYAFKKGTALVPTFLAIAITSLMERYFESMVNYEFTANMEDDLDAISRGEFENLAYLKSFYFGDGHPGLSNLVENGEQNIDPRDVCGIPLGAADDGRQIEVRIGRFGPFLTDGTHRASLPDSIAPDELKMDKAVQLLEDASRGPVPLGNRPETGEPIYIKTGRFGPYVQLGEGEEKPKMASLLSGMQPEEVSLETAVKLLGLPRLLGKHPISGEEVLAANGRFGPYIKSGSENRTIPADGASVLDITFEEAVELLKQPKTGRRAASQPKTLREVGRHPTSDAPLVVKSGRYGPYVTDGTVNASLPRGTTPEELTLEEAVNLLNARADKAPVKKKATRKKKA